MKVTLPDDLADYVDAMAKNNGLSAGAVAVDLMRTAMNSEVRGAKLAAEAAAFVEEVANKDGWKDESALDDLVHDCASLSGSAVNNGGWESQVEFIFREVGIEHGREQILAALGL
jgi:hypothetical protein